MSKLKLTRKVSFGALLLSAALFAGCGGGLSGTYESSHGAMSVKFDSGKAYVTTLGGTIQTAYEVDGNRVILKSPQGNLVLVRNKDGTLDGPLGTLTKTGQKAGPQ
ncbi:MAG: hypothetical protein ACRES9_04155 [Gammaproteobacteria bacterium]